MNARNRNDHRFQPVIESRPIADLQTDPRNPRVHTDKQIEMIAAAVAAFGFLVPVLIDASNMLITGNARILAALRLGMTEVPTICVTHLTKAEQRALVIESLVGLAFLVVAVVHRVPVPRVRSRRWPSRGRDDHPPLHAVGEVPREVARVEHGARLVEHVRRRRA